MSQSDDGSVVSEQSQGVPNSTGFALDDVDLGEFFQGNTLNISSTQQQYNYVLRQFNEAGRFEEYSGPCIVHPNNLTDVNIARFFAGELKRKGPKPHNLKKLRAAFGYAVKTCGLPTILDNHGDYPNTSNVIKAWTTRLKENPYHAVSADGFNSEQLKAIMGFPTETHEQLRDVAIVTWGCNTAMRSEDMHCMRNSNVSLLPASHKDPRRIRCVLDRTKNDRDGSGPEVDRTYVCPCVCLTVLKAKDPQRRQFLKHLRQDPYCLCPVTECPYRIMTKYIKACPNSKAGKDLSFFRALSARGDPRELAEGPYGKNMIRDTFKKINKLLPDDLRHGGKVTGHTGRQSLANNAINHGVSAHSTAAATKHRDNKSLKRYHKADDTVLAEAAMGQASAMFQNKENLIAGIPVNSQDSCSLYSSDAGSSRKKLKLQQKDSNVVDGAGSGAGSGSGASSGAGAAAPAFHFHLTQGK